MPTRSERHYRMGSKTTKANCFESGDQEFTLMVPCPPKNVVSTSSFTGFSLLPGARARRSTAPSILSLWVLVPLGKENTSIHLPSREKGGNQSSSSSLV